jgi:Zn-dependent protease
MMDSTFARLPEIVIQLVAFAFALSFHESAHGWVADRLGDPTARRLGRITLNPIKHVDLVGTIIFPIMLAVMGVPILGWAKPVPFVQNNLRNRRWGPALVGLAGPASNLLLAAVATTALLVLKPSVPNFELITEVPLTLQTLRILGPAAPLVLLLLWFAAINLILAVFNLVPIPPLDGSHLLEAALSRRWAYYYSRVGAYGMVILFALVYFGLFGRLIQPVLGLFSRILAA